MVRGRPSPAWPVYPQSPRLWLNMAGDSSQAWARRRARPGSPGRRTRSASGAVGWMWMVTKVSSGRARLDCASMTRGEPGRSVSAFRSPQEFREVMDRTFTLMSEDPEVGPRLRAADTPQQFKFTDLGMVVNIRAGSDNEPNLAWEWSNDVSWEPKVKLEMSSDTANRYFQGKE